MSLFVCVCVRQLLCLPGVSYLELLALKNQSHTPISGCYMFQFHSYQRQSSNNSSHQFLTYVIWTENTRIRFQLFKKIDERNPLRENTLWNSYLPRTGAGLQISITLLDYTPIITLITKLESWSFFRCWKNININAVQQLRNKGCFVFLFLSIRDQFILTS